MFLFWFQLGFNVVCILNISSSLELHWNHEHDLGDDFQKGKSFSFESSQRYTFIPSCQEMSKHANGTYKNMQTLLISKANKNSNKLALSDFPKETARCIWSVGKYVLWSTLFWLFLISSEKLHTHMELLIMVLEINIMSAF